MPRTLDLSGSSTLDSREESQALATITQSHIRRTAPTPNPSKHLPSLPPTQSADPASTLDSDQTVFKECFYPRWSCHSRELSVQTCISTCAPRHALVGGALFLSFFSPPPEKDWAGICIVHIYASDSAASDPSEGSWDQYFGIHSLSYLLFL